MTLIESETPLNNNMRKMTTTLQIIYILVILLFQILEINTSLIILDIFILAVTVLSLLVYAKSWLTSLNKYHNE